MAVPIGDKELGFARPEKGDLARCYFRPDDYPPLYVGDLCVGYGLLLEEDTAMEARFPAEYAGLSSRAWISSIWFLVQPAAGSAPSVYRCDEVDVSLF